MLNLFRLLIWTFVALISGSTAIIAGIFLYLAPNIESIDGLCGTRLETPLRILSSDQKLVRVFGEKRRTPIQYNQIPPRLVQAILAAEDDRFLYHYGVDIPGLLRAAGQLLATGEIKSGGSTITMQVAKNCLLSNERTFRRKFSEILLAIQIEREMSKEQILELYFNVIFLGKRAHGVQAAAERYYGQPVQQLELPQLAMIAGLPKAPSVYNPIVNPKRARQRRDWILGRMHHLGFINREQMEDARAQDITARIHDFEEPEVEADYLAEMVRDWMYERYGETAYTDGFRVITSINSQSQTHANRAVRLGLIEYDRRHGYRGPEGHVALPDTSQAETTAQQWQKLLGGRTAVGGLIPAVVISVADKSITAKTEKNAVTLPWQGLEWARRYVDEDTREDAPAKAADILQTGDIIRIEQVNNEVYRLAQLPDIQGALSVIEADNGAVRALVGGFDFAASKFNRAAQAKRQPGSTFKPFIYAAALEQGITAATIFNDAPVVESFDSSSQNTYVLNNASGINRGPTRMRVGLYRSVNTVSARVLQAVGIPGMLDYLEKMGMNTARMPRNLQLAVGGGTLEMSPLELASHYATLANGGYRIEPWFIERVIARDGSELYRANPLHVCPACAETLDPAPIAEEQAGVTEQIDDAELEASDSPEAEIASEAHTEKVNSPEPLQFRQADQILDSQAVFILNSIMRDVIQRGTGRKARVLGRSDLAGKTGTTDDARNLWFSGFNLKLVATAWVGFDEEKPLGKREYGSTAALPIWIHFMKEALRGQPEEFLPQPDGIVSMRINPDTGEAAAPGESAAIFELFAEGTEPEPSTSLGAHPDSPQMNGNRPEQLF